MDVVVTPELLNKLQTNHIYLSTVVDGALIHLPDDFEYESRTAQFGATQFPKRIGAYSYCHSSIPFAHLLSIGRYCSISEKVTIMGLAHPMDYLTSNPILFGWHHFKKEQFGHLEFQDLPYNLFPKEVNIGHDVWIGAEVMIKDGVQIGTGAVVAARSVVTKDVPPYAIVGGVPAKIIKYRFPATLINDLLASKWWEYDILDLNSCRLDSPEEFVKIFGQCREEIAGFRPFVLNRDTLFGDLVGK